ncbi:MAG: hypothetical protein KKE20_03450 [Nanoarchaeota archaeon]|nr:hypothetical protein [Nanoarchaeota archaeon]
MAKTISETPITMAELKEELKKIRSRDSELNFRAQKTEDYLNLFVGLSQAQAKELYGKIEKLNIPRFKPEHISKIVDILPSSVEEAKIVLSAYPITITNDNLKKIVDIVLPYIEMSKKEVKKQEAALDKIRKEEENKAESEKAEAAAEEIKEAEEKAAKEKPTKEKPKKAKAKKKPTTEEKEEAEESSEEPAE